ncbi:MAG TPA: hypothetical protein VKU41_29795 [Polyangiaceae bacterium]|nr:hypothetical protein [Polyangiaceae bacterium]
MGVLETAARIVELGGDRNRTELVREMRARFEARTGAFSPDDPWFEERSRAFWCDALTTGFGREVEPELSLEDRAWLAPLERGHRGLFRVEQTTAGATVLQDVWSGAEVEPTLVDDPSRAELDAAGGQLIDARVVGAFDPFVLALLPGAVFHSREATAAIEPVLAAARDRGMSTGDTLDALLRMGRTFRALSRVKASYAYRPDALAAQETAAAPVRRAAKGPR